MPTNIKVDRLALIKALEDEQKKLQAQFKTDMEKFRAAEKEFPNKLAKSLELLAKEARRGKKFETDSVYRNGRHTTRVVVDDKNLPVPPVKPTKDNGLCNLERQIRILKLSKQETITVNQQSEYVQFMCSLNGNS